MVNSEFYNDNNNEYIDLHNTDNSDVETTVNPNIVHKSTCHLYNNNNNKNVVASHPYTVQGPSKIGLYDPSFEKDACGVGMIVHVKSQQSHRLVIDALDILERLSHRGACGCDPYTGDGAGILIGMYNYICIKLLYITKPVF